MASNNKASDVVKEYIFNQLQEEKLVIGSRLPTEIELATKLNVGRNTVREALQELKGSGLVTSNQGSGYRISGTLEDSFSDVIRTLLTLKSISHNEISQLREALEIKAVELILKSHILEKDIQFLNTCIEEMKGNLKQAVNCDVKFHKKLAEMSHNTLISIFIQALSKFSDLYILIPWENISENEKVDLICVHQKIVDCIINGQLYQAQCEIKEHYKIADKIFNKTDILKTEPSIQKILDKLIENGYTEEDICHILENSINNLH